MGKVCLATTSPTFSKMFGTSNSICLAIVSTLDPMLPNSVRTHDSPRAVTDPVRLKRWRVGEPLLDPLPRSSRFKVMSTSTEGVAALSEDRGKGSTFFTWQSWMPHEAPWVDVSVTSL